jgi:hypothetical protein
MLASNLQSQIDLLQAGGLENTSAAYVHSSTIRLKYALFVVRFKGKAVLEVIVEKTANLSRMRRV